MRWLLVVRHAQSVWNAEGRWQGAADPPLSAAGVRQAREAAAVLAGALAAGDLPAPAVRVVSSDLRRSAQTAAAFARALGLDGEIAAVEDLREHDVGEWSGLTRPEIATRWPGMMEAWRDGHLAATPGGEARVDFDARVRRGLVAAAEGVSGGLGVIVSHGGVLRSLARWAGAAEHPVSHLQGYLLDAAAPLEAAGPPRAALLVDLLGRPALTQLQPAQPWRGAAGAGAPCGASAAEQPL